MITAWILFGITWVHCQQGCKKENLSVNIMQVTHQLIFMKDKLSVCYIDAESYTINY